MTLVHLALISRRADILPPVYVPRTSRRKTLKDTERRVITPKGQSQRAVPMSSPRLSLSFPRRGNLTSQKGNAFIPHLVKDSPLRLRCAGNDMGYAENDIRPFGTHLTPRRTMFVLTTEYTCLRQAGGKAQNWHHEGAISTRSPHVIATSLCVIATKGQSPNAARERSIPHLVYDSPLRRE